MMCIESEWNTGYTDEHATLKSMATRWNVSVATISNALKGRGAYRDVPVVWTDPLAPM